MSHRNKTASLLIPENKRQNCSITRRHSEHLLKDFLMHHLRPLCRFCFHCHLTHNELFSGGTIQTSDRILDQHSLSVLSQLLQNECGTSDDEVADAADAFIFTPDCRTQTRCVINGSTKFKSKYNVLLGLISAAKSAIQKLRKNVKQLA